MIKNFATPEDTSARASAFPTINYRPLGRSGLLVSPAGFGSYRVDIQNSTHQAALRTALENGLNLIDTSANYTDGGSERLIGSVLASMIASGQLRREEVVIVSKGGYLQGENFALSQQRKGQDRPWPDLVEYAPGLEHCLHPEFLADQIGRSLDRMQVETIDLYLLHNPEYYLGWAKKFDLPHQEAEVEYYRRIALAFDHLEEEVAAGRIRAYGVSSNAFPKPADSYDFTSLEKIWAIAGRNPQHHFQAIQLPFNLLETGAATEPNQSKARTVLQLARQLNLGVLANRPLNAVVGNNLIRLAPITETELQPDEDMVVGLIEELDNQEQRLQRAIFATDIPFRTKQEFSATTAGGRLLRERWLGFGTLSNWRDVRDGYLRPRTQFAASFARRRPELPPEAAGWIDSYEQIVEETLRQITAVYQGQEVETLAAIQANIAAAEPAWNDAASLSRTAVRALATTSGVSSVLVGMRRPDYVHDVLQVLENLPAADPHEAAWQLLAEAISLKG